MTSDEIKAAIERLDALVCDNVPSVYDVAGALACTNGYGLRNMLIDLLEQADPDGWTDERLREYGLARLPKDRDGKAICIGDTVWDDDDSHEWTVIGVGIGDVAPHFPIRCANELFETGFKTEQIIHHPPVTVESVLTELVDVAIGDITNKARNENMTYNDWVKSNEVIAEYAAKLRKVMADTTGI